MPPPTSPIFSKASARRPLNLSAAPLRAGAAAGPLALGTSSRSQGASAVWRPRQARSRPARLLGTDASRPPAAPPPRRPTSLQQQAASTRALPPYRHVYTRPLAPEHTAAVLKVLDAEGIRTTHLRETAERPYEAHAWVEVFEGVVTQIAITGIGPASGYSRERKSELLAQVRAALDGTNCHVYVSPEAIHINGPGIGKGTALEHFSLRVGVPLREVYRFGDRPAGNDAPLLDAPLVSFNVGEHPTPASSPAEWVGSLTGKTSADAVLAVLDRLSATGVAPRAVALDFDGTIGLKAADGDTRLDPRIAERLLEFLRSSPAVPVAIITGRGESILDRLVGELLRAGATSSDLSGLSLYLFNGGASVQPRVRNSSPAGTP